MIRYLATYDNESEVFFDRHSAWSWIYKQMMEHKNVWNWEAQERWDRFAAELLRVPETFDTRDPDGNLVNLELQYWSDDDYEG